MVRREFRKYLADHQKDAQADHDSSRRFGKLRFFGADSLVFAPDVCSPENLVVWKNRFRFFAGGENRGASRGFLSGKCGEKKRKPISENQQKSVPFQEAVRFSAFPTQSLCDYCSRNHRSVDFGDGEQSGFQESPDIPGNFLIFTVETVLGFIQSIYLSGPTASGKTRVALGLARALNAEILSMDSMSLYRKMDIGTAKPTSRERAEIPHHLIDILDPHEEYSVSDYVQTARKTVEEIRSRGRNALFVGGTPLYLKGLLRGIFQGPPGNPELRKTLQDSADSGFDLHRRLAEIDPISAQRLHPNDQRRIIRAIEIYELTGRPISEFQTQFQSPASDSEHRVYVLDWEKDALNHRIDRRVEEMFEQGFLEEARDLRKIHLGKTSSQALGYRELFDFLDGKYDSLPETVALIRLHTRQFAKRQRTWFRSLSECRFLPMSDSSTPEKIVEHILREI